MNDTSFFIQIGDGHFRPDARNADRYAAIDQIIDEGWKLANLCGWWWPGDVFHALSSTSDRNQLDLRFKRMASIAPVIVCYGNHDKDGELDGFANLKGEYQITVVSSPMVVRIALKNGRFLSLGCFPYPHRGGLFDAGVAHGDLVQTAEALLDPVFVSMGARLEAARAAGDLTAFIFHANIAGARTSVGQPQIGKEIELTPALLDRLGPIFKGGNHIHLPQELYGAWFAGSIAPQDYGEQERKRHLVIGINPDSSFTVESRPLRSQPMFHVDVAADRHGFHVLGEDQETADRFMRTDWSGCDVRVRVHFNDSDRVAIDFDAIRLQFVSGARLKFEPKVIADRELRAPAVAAARTLPDKLAAMRPDGALPVSVGDKLQLLMQKDRAEVLAHVTTRLQSVERGALEPETAVA